MVKPSQPMMARLRLTTKQVNGGYYKGNRTGSMGYFEKHGSYTIDWKKVRTYVVPENLADFKLTPFVTNQMPPTMSRYTKDVEKNGVTIKAPRAFQAKDYLDLWASDNAPEVIERERIEREQLEAQASSSAQNKARNMKRKKATKLQTSNESRKSSKRSE